MTPTEPATAATVPPGPGTTPPKVTVEVWTRGEGTEFPPEQIEAAVADVVRINDTWHVVVQLDD